MSVICQINNNYYVFSKGSPEIIKSICQEKYIPDNYNEIVNEQSIKGFRILGFGYKLITE